MQHSYVILLSKYKEHVLTDSRFYLNKEMTALEVGTREEAARNGWISMKEGIDIHGHDGWLHKIVNLTCLNE